MPFKTKYYNQSFQDQIYDSTCLNDFSSFKITVVITSPPTPSPKEIGLIL
jgi:hypothetical protein